MTSNILECSLVSLSAGCCQRRASLSYHQPGPDPETRDLGCNLTLGPGVCLQVTKLTKNQAMQCKQVIPKHVIAFNPFQPDSGSSAGVTPEHACPVLSEICL